ncbi:unnamed protein product [Heligmosomoides polygyrus]|uniref:Transposase n=1 Tax=Heligmosomoides polygyrus TaxID=6339 RepID=A0A183G0D6_HELPZ|nr:unnamed protein product [Heligmosomoides polygyrus]
MSEKVTESHSTLAWDRVVAKGHQDRVVERVDQDRVRRDQGNKRSLERVVELMPGLSNREEFGSMQHGGASHRQGKDVFDNASSFCSLWLTVWRTTSGIFLTENGNICLLTWADW